jgi:hypothetical protein
MTADRSLGSSRKSRLRTLRRSRRQVKSCSRYESWFTIVCRRDDQQRKSCGCNYRQDLIVLKITMRNRGLGDESQYLIKDKNKCICPSIATSRFPIPTIPSHHFPYLISTIRQPFSPSSFLVLQPINADSDYEVYSSAIPQQGPRYRLIINICESKNRSTQF